MKKIITIDREFGSGGRELGRRLAENLGISYYDHEIVTELTKRSDLAEEYLEHMDEKSPTALFPITVAMTFGMQNNYHMEKQLAVYTQTAKFIKEIAQKKDCVIVGRCADYILKDLKPLRIFIYAKMDSKIKRCKEKNYQDIKDLTDKQIEKKIRLVDRERRDYYNFYTNLEWSDKTNYDLCINTSHVDIKDFALLLKKLVESIYP